MIIQNPKIKSSFFVKGLMFLSLFLFWNCAQLNYLTQKRTLSPQVASRVQELKQLTQKPSLPVVVEPTIKEIEPQLAVSLTLEEDVSQIKVNSKVDGIILEAMTYLGTPYRYGGTTRSGIDCSAFIQKCFASQGVQLPRVSYRQAQEGFPILESEVRPGDLLFFCTTSRYRVTHVGLVVKAEEGEIDFIHAASSKGVSVASLSNSYWRKRFKEARRLPLSNAVTESVVAKQWLKNAASLSFASL